MRAKHDARISAMEASAALARETEARLTEERDDLARDVTRYKRGLLHLEAKRKAEAADATGRERALQASLDEALDAALEATRSAKVARDEAKRAKRESAESWARARKHHRADDPDEASETTLRQTTPARLLASLGARAARTATTTRDAAARVYARAKTRVVAAIADAALGATDAREAAPSRADEAVAAAVVAAAAAGALAAALAALALAALVRSDRTDRSDRSGLGRAPPDARKRPAAVAADGSETSPTKASIAAAAAAFDANPETFVLAAATGAGTTRNRAEVQPAPSSPATPAAAAGVHDGALKSALKHLASALGTPRTPAAGTRDAAGVESSPVLDLDAHSDDLPRAERERPPSRVADDPRRRAETRGGGDGDDDDAEGRGGRAGGEGAPGSGDSASSADAAARAGADRDGRRRAPDARAGGEVVGGARAPARAQDAHAHADGERRRRGETLGGIRRRRREGRGGDDDDAGARVGGGDAAAPSDGVQREAAPGAGRGDPRAERDGRGAGDVGGGRGGARQGVGGVRGRREHEEGLTRVTIAAECRGAPRSAAERRGADYLSRVSVNIFVHSFFLATYWYGRRGHRRRALLRRRRLLSPPAPPSLAAQNVRSELGARGAVLEEGEVALGRARPMPSLSRLFSSSGTYPVPLMMAMEEAYCLS